MWAVRGCGMKTLKTLRLYSHYRSRRLRHPWRLAGMSRVAVTVAKAIGTMLIAAGLVLAAADQAQAIHEAADNRVAAHLTTQQGEIEALRTIVAACMGDKEGALFIGGQLHLCRAVPTGVRK
jgi:hypothetical protein